MNLSYLCQKFKKFCELITATIILIPLAFIFEYATCRAERKLGSRPFSVFCLSSILKSYSCWGKSVPNVMASLKTS